jgi:hypothetical protein
MWLSGTIPMNREQRRLVRIDMFWDGASTPAVSAPVGDFFCSGLGLLVPFENALFSSPEGRSYNFTVPMPCRKSAKIQLVNESDAHALVWYDIKVPPPAWKAWRKRCGSEDRAGLLTGPA